MRFMPSMRRVRSHITLSLVVAGLYGLSRLSSCGGRPAPREPHVAGAPSVSPTTIATSPSASPLAGARACDGKGVLRVHFYDVAQGLAVLLDLPDGRRLLVDAGDSPKRSGCDDLCAAADAHLHGDVLDGLWITHPHSDHVGGAPEVLERFRVGWFADNGRDVGRLVPERARKAAKRRGTVVHAVEPETWDSSFLRGSWSEDVLRVRAVIPDRWKPDCREDENECSIGLRVDYCESSVLLVGDAERSEEKTLDTWGPATLLQVGHHGSDTSTSEAFLKRVKPKYAVISAGKPEQGLNVTYCHPRAATLERLNRHLGGKLDGTLPAFDGKVHCKAGTGEHWHDTALSDRVWATERDGDVTLSTHGDGVFVRE